MLKVERSQHATESEYRFDDQEDSTMLRAGLRTCIACIALLVLAACGGGSSNPVTATASVPALTATSTSMVTSSPTSVPSPTSATTPSPTATPAATPVPAVTPRPATPSPAATPTAIATPAASPGTGLATGSPTPQPTDKVTAQLATGVTSAYAPVNPTTVFSPGTAKIFLVFSTTDLPQNSSLDTVWIAVKVDADVKPGYEIDRAHLAVHGSQTGDFSLSAPASGFPTGSYKVDLYLNGTLIGTYPYQVK